MRNERATFVEQRLNDVDGRRRLFSAFFFVLLLFLFLVFFLGRIQLLFYLGGIIIVTNSTYERRSSLIFSRDEATLYEGVSVSPSVGRMVGPQPVIFPAY